MSDVQTTLSLCTALAELTIWAIVFWFVCSWIGMSPRAILIVRVLIVAIAIMVSLHDIIGTYGAGSETRPYRPLSSLMPSIMAPERR